MLGDSVLSGSGSGSGSGFGFLTYFLLGLTTTGSATGSTRTLSATATTGSATTGSATRTSSATATGLFFNASFASLFSLLAATNFSVAAICFSVRGFLGFSNELIFKISLDNI